MTKRAMIIGCGPSGILAAHAALLCGVGPTIVAPKVEPSVQFGAQYLHTRIPEVSNGMPFRIKYRHLGTEEEYKRRIYGDKPVNTSWNSFKHSEVAYDLRPMYESLFYEYEELITGDVFADADMVETAIEEYDYVLNTAPLHSIYPLGEYEVEHVLISRAPDGHGDWLFTAENEIIYNGSDRAQPPWYRASRIRNTVMVEYPDGTPLHSSADAKRIAKPLKCHVNSRGLYRIGRYGKWTKGVLVDHAFKEAMDIFQDRKTWMETQTRIG